MILQGCACLSFGKSFGGLCMEWVILEAVFSWRVPGARCHFCREGHAVWRTTRQQHHAFSRPVASQARAWLTYLTREALKKATLGWKLANIPWIQFNWNKTTAPRWNVVIFLFLSELFGIDFPCGGFIARRCCFRDSLAISSKCYGALEIHDYDQVRYIIQEVKHTSQHGK